MKTKRKIVVNAEVRKLIEELADHFERSLEALEQMRQESDWEKQSELALDRRHYDALLKGCAWRLVCAATGRKEVDA